MNFEIKFENRVSERIWNSYFCRIQKMLKKAPKDQREELQLEIKSHLFESMQDDPAEKEEERVLNAIEKMGEPQDYLKPFIAEKLLMNASKTMKPQSVILGLFYSSVINIKYALSAFLFSIGYALSFMMVLLAFTKLIMPSCMGLYKLSDGKYEFTIDTTAKLGDDILGYWIVVFGLLAAAVLYILLTKLLKLLVLKN